MAGLQTDAVCGEALDRVGDHSDFITRKKSALYRAITVAVQGFLAGLSYSDGIEENRMVRDIGGGELIETRGRGTRDRTPLPRGVGQAAAVRGDRVREAQLHAVGSNDYNGHADRDGDDSAMAEKPAAAA